MVDVLPLISAVLSGVSFFLAIIVLGVTNGELKHSLTDINICQLGALEVSDKDFRGCDTATAIGAIGLVVGLVFSVLAVVEVIKPEALIVLASKTTMIIRGVVAAITAFVWLICFGIVVDEYNENSVASTNLFSGKSGAQAVSAFSFFSVLTWGGLAVIYIVFRGVRGNAGTPSAAPTPV